MMVGVDLCAYNIILYLRYKHDLLFLSFIRYLRCNLRVNPSRVLLASPLDDLHHNRHVNLSCVLLFNPPDNQHNSQQVTERTNRMFDQNFILIFTYLHCKHFFYYTLCINAFISSSFSCSLFDRFVVLMIN